MTKAIETNRAYNEGATAAAYSLGIGVCPYAYSTELGKAWHNGYREAYAKG